MKRTSLVVVSLLALTFVWAGLVSASPTIEIRADIPFAFSVNNQVLPAGSYEIIKDDNTSMLRIRNEATRRSTIFAVNTPFWRTVSAPTAKLKFNRYGDQYFLSVISTYDSTQNVRNTKSEREAARQASRNLAMEGPEVIEVTGQ